MRANVETKDLSEINYADYNPRILSEHDGKSLTNSMTKFGDIAGITNNIHTNTLVTGHQRLRTLNLKFPGLVKIHVTKLDKPDEFGTVGTGYVGIDGTSLRLSYREVSWDIGIEKAANIAANRIEAEWDKELLGKLDYELSLLDNGAELLALTGQKDDEISRLLDGVGALGESEEDDAPAVDEVNPQVSKLGEIYQLGDHRLMCGDAIDFGALSDLMDGKQADMVFTDPPYNVAYEGKTAEALTIENDSMSDADFYKFLLSVHQNMSEVTKPGGSIYVCHADSEGLNFRKALIDSGFLLKQCLIWVKQQFVMGRQDYQWMHEPILYGWKEGASHYFVDDHTQTTVWNIDRPSKSLEHPTMKPIALCARAIKNSSLRDQLVLDVFGGSGSTLMAAEETDRTCYMMELSPLYIDVIIKRWQKHTGQEAIRIEDGKSWNQLSQEIQTAPKIENITVNTTN